MNNKKSLYLRAFKRIPYKIIVIAKYLLSSAKQKSLRLKNIEEIRDKHKGEAIFLVGSGPSLDTYPDDFLKDKISMTLHLAYLKFPDPTYTHIAEADRIQWFMKNRPEFFRAQGLFCNPLFPLVQPHSILKGLDMEPHYFLKYNPRRLNIKNVEKQIKAALTSKNIKYQSNSTCLHTGIWSALILGFKNINLIGCDHSHVSSHQDDTVKHYFSSGYVDDTRARTQGFYEDAYYKMNVFTKEIGNVLKKYNIVINRYLNYEDFQNKTTGKEKYVL